MWSNVIKRDQMWSNAMPMLSPTPIDAVFTVEVYFPIKNIIFDNNGPWFLYSRSKVTRVLQCPFWRNFGKIAFVYARWPRFGQPSVIWSIRHDAGAQGPLCEMAEVAEIRPTVCNLYVLAVAYEFWSMVYVAWRLRQDGRDSAYYLQSGPLNVNFAYIAMVCFVCSRSICWMTTL